jgi:hypothetical protein
LGLLQVGSWKQKLEVLQMAKGLPVRTLLLKLAFEVG